MKKTGLRHLTILSDFVESTAEAYVIISQALCYEENCL